MGELLKMPRPQFTHTSGTLGGMTFVFSTCTKCGRKRLVSKNDGTLDSWEKGHICVVNENNILAFKQKA
jgi:hypothetical protein